ncbi:hypothetical protein J6590_020019 [Homalodisca vitripennis]|nr:hypothetical protein J6590_020019 [Homalodisca vitripennis]
MIDLFDTSDYPQPNIYNMTRVNKKVLGKIQDKLNVIIINEYVTFDCIQLNKQTVAVNEKNEIIVRCHPVVQTTGNSCNMLQGQLLHAATQLLSCYVKCRPSLPGIKNHSLRELGLSNRTVVDWYSFTRESKKLGGPISVVQIDEANFGKRNYDLGRCIKGQWMFVLTILRQNPSSFLWIRETLRHAGNNRGVDSSWDNCNQ